MDFDVRNEQRVKLSQVITGEKFKFLYTYDMGDSWEHEVLVEKVLPADSQVRYPVCLTGKRACPPENCGGVGGYALFLEAIQDPGHPDYEALLEWVGGEFDPEAFDVDAVNRMLRHVR
jgi:Plasmid pRiA4b ORF-3-like protein